MIRIANAPCSWGALEFDLQGQTAGYQQVLNEMVETGYAGTELGDWGFMPTDPMQLSAELHSRGLRLVGAFVPVMLKDPAARAGGIQTAIRVARLLSAVEGQTPFIVLADDNGKDPVRTRGAGRITPDLGLSTEAWETAAATANAVAKAVKDETGLRTVFHHHCGGYVETPNETARLLELTDPALLGLCLDTGHYRYGGGDPLAAFERFRSRLWHVHFKDCQPEVAEQARQEGWDYFKAVAGGVFCELGQGEVPFEQVKKALEEMGYEGWIVVEQDVLPGMGSPKSSAARNRAYLRSIGL